MRDYKYKIEGLTESKEEHLSAIEMGGNLYIYNSKKECAAALDLAMKKTIEIFKDNVRKYGRVEREPLGTVYWLTPFGTIITIHYIGEEMKKELCKKPIYPPAIVERKALKKFAQFFENEAREYERDERMYLIYSQTAEELRRMLEELYDINKYIRSVLSNQDKREISRESYLNYLFKLLY